MGVSLQVLESSVWGNADERDIVARDSDDGGHRTSAVVRWKYSARMIFCTGLAGAPA